MRKQIAVWGGTFLVAVLLSLTPTDTPTAQAQGEVPPAPHLTSETIDHGNGWGQTLWRDAEGRPYDLGVVIRLPSPFVSAPVASGVEGMIRAAARRWGLDEARMLRVAWCESKYDPYAVGDGGRSVGVFQFQAALWSETPQGRAGLDRRNAAANIEAAMWGWATGKRSHWSCQG